jgi:hypothetical protein
MKNKLLLTISMFVLFATTFAYAAEPVAKGNIPFQFKAGDKVLPAGQYEFVPDNQAKLMTVRSTPAGPSAMVIVLTRLAAGIHTTAADSHVVFDKVGDTYTLSEVWVPGADGFLLNVVKSKHEHKIIDVPR